MNQRKAQNPPPLASRARRHHGPRRRPPPGRPDLLCAVLRPAADLRSSDEAMVDLKDRWKHAAVLAVTKCGEKGAGKKVNATAKRAALLLVMGHGQSTSPEVCLHYLLASGDVDSVVLGAAVAELDGEEVVRLVTYLTKWIGK